jgi:iron complex outermembrane receptor protein
MKRFLTLFLMLISFLIVAQKHTKCSSSLSGKVLDEHNSEPLAYATIYIEEIKRGTSSDAEGNYSIENLCDGKYKVIITHIGCEPVVQKVDIKGHTKRNFYPEHHTEELKEFEVATQKDDDLPSTQNVSKLNQKEINQLKGKNLGQTLERIPGVTTLNTGNGVSKPVIHGLHSNRVLIINNGVRQEGQQWGVEHAPEIDPFTANKLRVIKGANSVKYGADAIGGVILIDPKELRDSLGIDGEINLSAHSNGKQGAGSAELQGNPKKLSGLKWRIQGSGKKAGNINTPNYYMKNTGIEEYNFSGILNYNKTKYGAEVYYSQFNTNLAVFSGSHIGNLTDLQIAFNAATPFDSSGFSYDINRPFQHVEHELFNIKAFYFTGESGKLNVSYSRQYNLRSEYDRRKPYNDSLAALDLPELQLEITTHITEVNWEHFKHKKLSGEIGASLMQQGNTYEGRFFIPNYKSNTIGLYLIEKYSLENLIFEGGVRFDYRHLQSFYYEKDVLLSPIKQFNNFSGSIGFSSNFKEDFTLKFNLSTAWRSPSVNELYSYGVHHGAASFEIGNGNLVSENAYNINSTLLVDKKKIQLEVSPYVNYIKNFIYLKPTLQPVLTIRGAFPGFEYTQTDALLYGSDLYLKWNVIGKLSLVNKTALLRALNITTNEYLVQMPSDRTSFSLEYDFNSWKVFNDSYLSLTLSHVTKQIRVPENSDYVDPPGAYTLIGIEAFTKIKKVELGVGVENLTNAIYRNYLNRFRYYSDEIGRNISVKLKIPINQ